MKKVNLAVIFGGKSGEHEVSLSSARSVMEALDKEKYKIIPIAITKKGNWLLGDKGARYMKLHEDKAGKENAISIEESQSLVTISDDERGMDKFMEGDTGGKKIDLVLPILHGPYGEDGRLQGMLDTLGVPYVFSGVLAHAIAMNKSKAKVIASAGGVPTAKEVIIKKDEEYNIEKIADEIKLPVIVKPSELGSSVGINIAKTKQELVDSVKDAFSYGDEVMIEKYIKGREFTVTVMEDKNEIKALAVTEIIPLISEFYDYKAKYEDGGSKHVCPADIPEEDYKKISDYGIKVFEAVGCKGLARADFVWDEDANEFYFIDLNTIPGMTKTSLAPEAAREAGMEFGDFLDRLIDDILSKINK